MGWATENQRWPALSWVTQGEEQVVQCEHPQDQALEPQHPQDQALEPQHPQVQALEPQHPQVQALEPQHPRDQVRGSSLQQCRVQPGMQACRCASSEYQGKPKAMTDVPHTLCEDGGGEAVTYLPAGVLIG